jgi:hypothetical protein
VALDGLAFSSVNRVDPNKYLGNIEKTQTVKLSDDAARSASRSSLEGMGYEVAGL